MLSSSVVFVGGSAVIAAAAVRFVVFVSRVVVSNVAGARGSTSNRTVDDTRSFTVDIGALIAEGCERTRGIAIDF